MRLIETFFFESSESKRYVLESRYEPHHGPGRDTRRTLASVAVLRESWACSRAGPANTRSASDGDAQPDQVGSLCARRACQGGSPAPEDVCSVRSHVGVAICGARRGLTHAAAPVLGRRGCTPQFLDETAGDDAEEEIVYTVPDKIVFKVALSAPTRAAACTCSRCVRVPVWCAPRARGVKARARVSLSARRTTRPWNRATQPPGSSLCACLKM